MIRENGSTNRYGFMHAIAYGFDVASDAGETGKMC
jgi:hypothetical protein